MNTPLDGHQHALLATLVEAASRSKSRGPDFKYRRMAPDNVPVFEHPGLRETLRASMADIEVLRDEGLITLQAPIAGVGHLQLTSAAFATYEQLKNYPEPHQPQVGNSGSYVELSRLCELRAISSTNYDLTRLVCLCEELNVSSAQGTFHATAMLVRAILDHVPPIFGASSFTHIASNVTGSRSFKDAMGALETAARKIADAHLHTQIRKREVLPTATQVNFSPQIDMLLSEIVRLLK